MQIEIDDNPNCRGCDLMVFQELGPSRKIRGIKASVDGSDLDCDVVGVACEGQIGEAYATKIMDSGEAEAYLIHGAEWGIRIRPGNAKDQGWDLQNKQQWGECYKIYGAEHDIIYA